MNIEKPEDKKPCASQTVDVERAKIAPSEEFDRPAEVILSRQVSGSDKEKILEQWETDARALTRAGDEGMSGGEPSRLPEVQKARRRVRASNKRKRKR